MRSVDKLIGNIHTAINNDPEVRLDIVKLYNCTTFDIMGELTFGETLGLLDKSEYSPWVSAIFRSVKAIEFGRLSLDYPILRRIMDIVLPASISKGEDEHYKYSSDRVDRRLEKGADQADIWNLVLHKNEGVLNLDEMHANGMIFMIAGTETTATLLSGLTYSLLTNPDKLQRAVEEVRSLPEDQLNLEVLPRLKYLSACFDEGFRTYPPVPTAMLREVPEGGNVICGEWVPAKTRIGVPQYVAYHSASNFKDPDSFVPERWLPGTGYDDDKKEVLQPFLYGPRNCIGKNLAYHEMRLIFSKVLWHFDLSICSESREWTDQKVWSLWDKPPLWINAKKVERK
ncbi:Averantin hydroxylase [Lasiodiplodia theobromae]|uniref:Averantin hydroxylase n=1 Tax=Lasiodiplodia theobromae TaxID=45133 RepID=A0A5N5D690_9PEZI|nr:Averantin hydroxylase [Lasiodiplodia theobromae]